MSEDILNQLAYFVHNEERMPAGLVCTAPGDVILDPFTSTQIAKDRISKELEAL